MNKFNADIELLKEILENIHNPGALDSHPWTKCLFVQDLVIQKPTIQSRSPGDQLIFAITQLFHQMMPAVPPHEGKRLDSHWGKFGLLAAMYFAPLEFGAPRPNTFRDAWGRIDSSILSFVSAEQQNTTTKVDINRYKLVSDEPGTGPASTISDWRRKGIEQLAEIINREEQRLVMLSGSHANSRMGVIWLKPIWHWLRWGLLLVITIIIVQVGLRAWRIYQRIQDIRGHLEALESYSLSNLNVEQINSAGTHLYLLRNELIILQNEAAPIMYLAPHLGWLPIYGGDLSQTPALLEMATQLSIMGDETLQVIAPIVSDVLGDRNSTSIPGLLELLKNADTQLLTAQFALSQARTARQQIQTERLSEELRTVLLERVDPLLLAMQGAFPVDDVLQMARIAPRLLGAVEIRPITYLILIQNEDELRPTGGFITAVGWITVEDGLLTEISFEGVSKLDDFNKPYPASPWQLDEYMRSEILILRDANWFTNFPTSVEWVKFLYAYTRPQMIDGVITIDQHVVVQILREIGPIVVEEEDELITTENVLDYMRQERSELPPIGVDADIWDRKQFINRMAHAMTKKLLSRQGYSLNALLRIIMQLLDEKHILLQFDDPEMKQLLAKRGWNGVVHPPSNSDFLMVVDANIGFNKTNLVMDKSLVYQVDLQNLTNPLAYLSVSHINHAEGEHTCYQYPATVGIKSKQEYPFNDCYWNYMRVYKPAGSQLFGSTPHAIPAGWTLREAPVPAQVDQLGDENIPGATVYGTLMVVPPGDNLITSFDMYLPQYVLERNRQSLAWTYKLTVQKQPGTVAVPFNLKLLLPSGVQVSDSSHKLQWKEGFWILNTDLRQDLEFYMIFSPTN